MTVVRRYALPLCIAASAACGGSDATAPDGRPAVVSRYGDTDRQTAIVGTAVANPPAVLVADARGKPVPGVIVTFTVTAGGGTVTAAPDATPGGIGTTSTTAVTDGNGTATIGSWKLGADVGQNTLSAAVGNGVRPIVFAATAADACTFASSVALGTPATGTLASNDCDDGYFYYDFYRTTVITGGAVLFTVNSTAFDSYEQLVDEAGSFIAINDNFGSYNAGIKALLRTNSYILAASSSAEHRTGPYTVSAQATNSSIERCEEVWASRGITTTQDISTTDCVDTSRSYYSDRIEIVLYRGQTLTITMNSSAFDTYLTLADVSGLLVAEDDNGNGVTNSRIVYTASTTAAYIIDAGSKLPGQTGSYILAIR